MLKRVGLAIGAILIVQILLILRLREHAFKGQYMIIDDTNYLKMFENTSSIIKNESIFKDIELGQKRGQIRIEVRSKNGQIQFIPPFQQSQIIINLNYLNGNHSNLVKIKIKMSDYVKYDKKQILGLPIQIVKKDQMDQSKYLQNTVLFYGAITFNQRSNRGLLQSKCSSLHIYDNNYAVILNQFQYQGHFETVFVFAFMFCFKMIFPMFIIFHSFDKIKQEASRLSLYAIFQSCTPSVFILITIFSSNMAWLFIPIFITSVAILVLFIVKNTRLIMLIWPFFFSYKKYYLMIMTLLRYKNINTQFVSYRILLCLLVFIPQIIKNFRERPLKNKNLLYIYGYLGLSMLHDYCDVKDYDKWISIQLSILNVLIVALLYLCLTTIIILQHIYYSPVPLMNCLIKYKLQYNAQQPTCSICLSSIFDAMANNLSPISSSQTTENSGLLQNTQILPQNQQSKLEQVLVFRTTCQHLFHRKCLFEWIKYKLECPICRSIFYQK